jgi:hypothetical protein
MVAAAVIIALAIGGGAVALVTSQKKSNNDARVVTVQQAAASSSDTSNDTTTDSADTSTDSFDTSTDSTTTDSTVSSSTGLLPDEPRSVMRAEIQSLLREWHQDLASGDYRAAWDLLSARKRRQNLRKYGYSQWVTGQSSLGNYIDPSGLRASIQEVDNATGVVRVMVTHLRYFGSAHCVPSGYWNGITWVKYEDGEWKYDPGYSTTPQRQRDWKSRFSELLGGSCN